MGHGFKVGDYVRHDRDGYDNERGSFIEGRLALVTDDQFVVAVERSAGTGFLNFKKGDEYRVWPGLSGDSDDFKRLRKVSAPFKLTDGARVKNVRTGRVGLVFESVVYQRGSLIVVDQHCELNEANYRNAPLASQLEAYEAEHPGTYDIVTEGAPW